MSAGPDENFPIVLIGRKRWTTYAWRGTARVTPTNIRAEFNDCPANNVRWDRFELVLGGTVIAGPQELHTDARLRKHASLNLYEIRLTFARRA